MWNELIELMNKTNSLYKEMLEITEKKFNFLKKQKINEIEKLEKEEKLLLFDIQDGNEKIKKEIKKISIQNNSISEKLSDILIYANENQKIKINDLKNETLELEKNIMNGLKMNEYLLLAFMETNKVILETAIHVAKEENHGERLFINEEF